MHVGLGNIFSLSTTERTKTERLSDQWGLITVPVGDAGPHGAT